MMLQPKPFKLKKIRAELEKEYSFLKNVFSVLNLPTQKEVIPEQFHENRNKSNDTKTDSKDLPKRALSITELKEKLQNIKGNKNFNLKRKLAKKSLTSKINKQSRKGERSSIKIPKQDVKKASSKSDETNPTKPVFNNDGKLVFSKFDFASAGHQDKLHKDKNPKKILADLEFQEKKLHQLEETQNTEIAKNIKEKVAWKQILQKAEGQKVKDDPVLLKKSIKKIEQKKKTSKKQWENRTQTVEQNLAKRQKKRKENIHKKKQEKKNKKIKSAVKKGRVVLTN